MTLQQILEKVKKGQLSVEHAEDLLKKEGYEEMDYAKLDTTRKARTGFAEVVYCARKADEHLLNIYQKLYEEDGDILILDEVLSVGDAKFRKKSEKKVLSMFDKGVTVLFVSHSLEQVQRLCNKAMILEKGKLIAYGDIDEISAKYAEMIR